MSGAIGFDPKDFPGEWIASFGKKVWAHGFDFYQVEKQAQEELGTPEERLNRSKRRRLKKLFADNSPDIRLAITSNSPVLFWKVSEKGRITTMHRLSIINGKLP